MITVARARTDNGIMEIPGTGQEEVETKDIRFSTQNDYA